MQFSDTGTVATAQLDERAIYAMVQAAKDAGAPPDQVMTFARAGYIPTPQQWKFHAAARAADNPEAPNHIAMGGARGGAKSHAIMCQVGLDDCQRFPGLDVLYLRQIQKAGRKALDQLRAKTIMSLKHRYNRNEGLIGFPNGSTIVVGHFKNEGDIDQYVGIEYDEIVIEERTQLPKYKLDQLFGSLRTAKAFRPRSYSAANPGGIGHVDFKEEFIIPMRQKERGEQPAKDDTLFIPMDWRHNPFINPEYKAYLLGLEGTLRRMWTDGDWDVGAGTYFIHWDIKRHVIKPIDLIPREWPMWVSIDWGYAHPCVIHWHTVTPEGEIYTVYEYTAMRQLVPHYAERIKNISANVLNRRISEIAGWVAGHDMFHNRGADRLGLTIAEQFSDEGIYWTKANVDRINGAQQMALRMGNPEQNVKATWFVYDNCELLIDTIPRMLSDEKRPEDVLKIDADEFGEGGDDAYDSARYGLMVRPKMITAGGFQWQY